MLDDLYSGFCEGAHLFDPSITIIVNNNLLNKMQI